MELIRVTTDGPLTTVTIDSPPLNLFDARLIGELRETIATIQADPPRALLIRAEGKVVSGGVNVEEFKDLTPAQGSALWTDLLGLIENIEALPLPVVFSAHGLTLTAAFELSLACDIIIAAESAKFGLVEIVVGLTPSMGGPQRLAERAGTGRAKQLVMTGGLFDAATLEQWNVVNIVVPDDQLEEKAAKLATRLANGPTRAHAMTKRILRGYVEGGVPAADRVTKREAADLFGTEDLKNAVETFLAEGPGNATFRRQIARLTSMKKLTILLTLLLASMAMVAAGCGGSDDDSGPSKEEYIAQADKICEESNAEIVKIGEELGPDPSDKEAAEAVKTDLLPELEARAQELEALERPSGDEDELESYYQDLDDGISTVADDPEGAIASDENPFEASDKAAQEYGFKVCGSDG